MCNRAGLALPAPRKPYLTTHRHSVWPPHHIENACPCRQLGITGKAVHLPAKRNLRLAREQGDGKGLVPIVFALARHARFPPARSLAIPRFRLAFPPSRDTAFLICRCLHLRITASIFRPNGMVEALPLFLGLTIMLLPSAQGLPNVH